MDQAAAADVYECKVIEALYLTPEGYKQHYGDTLAYVDHQITIDKITGAVLGPMYSSLLTWRRVRAPSEYDYFETAGYGLSGKFAANIIVKELFRKNEKKRSWH
jgi:hypothetical protein